MITEEQKQEADNVVNTYSFLTDHFGNFDILCAIQDRQSVLEDNKKWYKLLKETATESSYLPIKQRIQSLTQQIDYLKSKL